MLKILALSLTFATATNSAKEVESVLASYRKAPAIQAKVKKTVVQEALGTRMESEGEFYFSKGKLRLEMHSPDKTMIVYDGKYVWLESWLDAQTIEVTKIKSNSLKKSDSVLAALFERKDILSKFKLVTNKTEDGAKVFGFEPKDKKKTELRYLELSVSGKDLKTVTYKDQLENQVTFEFEGLSRGEVPVSKFKYKPPKQANVTTINE